MIATGARVGVVIPCFNDGRYLGECLESLYGQTLAGWVAVIVDDGSTEALTREVLSAVRDPRVTVLRHGANRGLAAARNTGIAALERPFVLPLDADDQLAPRYLEKTVEVLEADPRVDCVFPWFQCFGAESGVRAFVPGDVASMLIAQWIPGPGTLMRRALWERAGGYCEDPALHAGNEDWDFWIAALRAGCVPAVIPEALYRYRVKRESMVTRLRRREDVTRRFIVSRHRVIFDAHGLRRRFLADGYQRASLAAWNDGDAWRALRKALRGWLLDVRRRDLALLVLMGLAPRPVLRAIRSARHHWRRAERPGL
jgi:glycosyltransferase involved in cell wall biosynthesis